MKSSEYEMILFEDGRCEHSECSLKTVEYDDSLKNIISREEFEQLQGEHLEEVEGVTYEEYCETERECWSDMLADLLLPPWEKLRVRNKRNGPDISQGSIS